MQKKEKNGDSSGNQWNRNEQRKPALAEEEQNRGVKQQ